jgi:hypothetical protein
MVATGRASEVDPGSMPGGLLDDQRPEGIGFRQEQEEPTNMARPRPGSNRVFLPSLNDQALEPRIVMARVSAVAAAAAAAARRLTPVQKIAQEYASFAADFQAVQAVYLAAIGGSGSGVATATLAQAMSPNSGLMVVDDTSGLPLPTATTPMTLTASVNGSVVGLYQAGGVVGTTLTQVQVFDPTQNAFRAFLPTDASLPAGTVLSASVSGPDSGDTDALSQFQTYVTGRLQTMSQTLITYLNRLPIKLPRSPSTPRNPGPRNAVQLVVFRQLTGNTSSSLKNTLLAIPVPTSSSATDLAFYQATTQQAIATSQNALLESFRLTFTSENTLGEGSRIPTIPAKTVYR